MSLSGMSLGEGTMGKKTLQCNRHICTAIDLTFFKPGLQEKCRKNDDLVALLS